MDELTDILVGLEQRITAYKNRLQDLEQNRRRIDDEIACIKKSLELAETLYRVEADQAGVPSLSILPNSDDKGVRPGLRLGRSAYAGTRAPGRGSNPVFLLKHSRIS